MFNFSAVGFHQQLPVHRPPPTMKVTLGDAADWGLIARRQVRHVMLRTTSYNHEQVYEIIINYMITESVDALE